MRKTIMNKAEELREIAKKTRESTRVDRQFEHMLDQMQQIAEMEGNTEIDFQIMTRKFFEETKERLSVPEGMNVEDFIDRLYAEQREVLDRLRGEGFRVTEEDLDLPSLLDINLDPQTRQQVEHTKKYIEKAVKISWE